MISYIKTEDELFLTCDFASDLYDFVKSIAGENHWYFKQATKNSNDAYSVHFVSYDTHEYSKFFLAIAVERNNKEYSFRILKQVTDLI